MTMNITTKVGKGQANSKISDNTTVQNLLNKFIQAGCITGIAPLIPDGQVGSKTVAAIGKFQTDIVGFNFPDSYVSPGGQTLATLNGPLKWANNKPPTQPGNGGTPNKDKDTGTENNANLDAKLSTNWAIACLSHQKYVLTLELLNRDTDRAHKLIFTGAGSDTVSKPFNWTEGQYYQKFETKFAANFDNFANPITILIPEYGHESIHHILRFGLLATLKISQCPGTIFGEWNLYGTSKLVYGSGVRSKSLIFAPYYPNIPKDTNPSPSQYY